MKNFSKIISVVLAVMLAVTAMACMASAKVDGCTCACCGLSSGNGTVEGTADDGIRDIYLVLDISGSMSGTPVKSLKESAKTFCAMMLNEAAGDNRIAIVTYATSVTSYSFSTDIDELNATIDGIKAKGSTNMYDAIMKVKELNEKFGREDASKHVVVMADGLPNESATLTVGKYTSKDSSMYYKHGNAVYSVASGMWFDYSIYSIGFFHNLGGSQLKYGKTLMDDIDNQIYLEVFNPEELIEAFTGVADSIIGCICEEGCTCGDDYGCCECCTSDDGPCVEPDENGNCNCSENCTCGADCNCGENCTCCGNNDDNNNNNNNGDNNNDDDNGLNGGDNNGDEDDIGDKDEDKIPPTGDSSIAIAATAVMMLAGIGILASKKRED